MDSRSPSWGAWIEIIDISDTSAGASGRSPSWGAWIEIITCIISPVRCSGRSPSWGAWIEITSLSSKTGFVTVAPPRGERGLKFTDEVMPLLSDRVAPPRGERGLKLIIM